MCYVRAACLNAGVFEGYSAVKAEDGIMTICYADGLLLKRFCGAVCRHKKTGAAVAAPALNNFKLQIQINRALRSI